MKRRLLLLLTFLLTIVGFWGLLTSNAEDKTEEPPQHQDVLNDDVSVWIAYSAIEKGEPVTLEKVRPTIITAEEARLTESTQQISMSETENHIATADIQSGEIISARNLCSFYSESCQKLIMAPDKAPYPLVIKGSSEFYHLLKPGDLIDVMLIATPAQSMAYREELTRYQGLSVIPLLRKQMVLQVPDLKDNDDYSSKKDKKQTIILAMTPENAAKVMIAKRIGILDIQKSTDKAHPEIDISEIVPDFSIIKELRGNKRVEQMPN
ncbi:RcpC/CpaB family pilus assembly protein [Parendozoicomonas sp. Alg238-R29]|uniref:RcpC/CpaB family pilus assembly protein n=1 Tax=Parendozoicomonas sp. Alg238-R29 TaxID=2993446 RepID=UPI00248E1E21|nr:RcpC/CpaB family pilus assembly protein [Parendozoicomonas sp. Alg238-R29]